MKKSFIIFSILSTLFFFSNISYSAVISSGTVASVGVVADFSNLGTVDFSIELRNIDDDELTDTINWKIQDIQFPKKTQTDQWVWSTTYAVIKATVTDPTVTYYLYQKNTEGTVYIATCPRTNADGSQVYSGLVNKDLQGGEYGGYVPLSYLFTADKISSSELQSSYDPDRYDPGKGSTLDDKVSRYFTDEADKDEDGNSNFDIQYTVIACANTGGIAFYPYGPDGYAPWSPLSVMTSKTAYMYFGGNFITLLKENPVFGTDKIVIEKVVE